jgi:hypothetical protein
VLGATFWNDVLRWGARSAVGPIRRVSTSGRFHRAAVSSAGKKLPLIACGDCSADGRCVGDSVNCSFSIYHLCSILTHSNHVVFQEFVQASKSMMGNQSTTSARRTQPFPMPPLQHARIQRPQIHNTSPSASNISRGRMKLLTDNPSSIVFLERHQGCRHPLPRSLKRGVCSRAHLPEAGERQPGCDCDTRPGQRA